LSEGPLRVRRHGQASAPYQALLREYLRGRLALDPERPEDRRLADDIITAADGRFAYVSFLADRLEQSPPGDLAGLGAGEGLYRRWLAGLDLEYGRKQADAMRQVLALLAAAEAAHAWVFDAGRKTDPATGGVLTPLSEQFEGLEVGLLARLLDLDRPQAVAYDRIDLGLLVTLQTPQGVLWVWRGGECASAAPLRAGMLEGAGMTGVTMQSAPSMRSAAPSAWRTSSSTSSHPTPAPLQDRSLWRRWFGRQGRRR
jgi:hypothetical protein